MIFRIIRRLFGGEPEQPARSSHDPDRVSAHPFGSGRPYHTDLKLADPFAAPLQPRAHEADNADRASDEYFSLSAKLEEAHRARDYRRVVLYCKQSLPLLEDMVQAWKRDFGSFDISSIRAIDLGAKLMVAMGDEAGLDQMRRATAAIPELETWHEMVQDAQKDVRIVREIMDLVEKTPGLLQKDLRKHLPYEHSNLSNLCEWLDKIGRLRRERSGESYRLFASREAVPVDSPMLPTPTSGLKRESGRRRPPREPRELDLSSVLYVPLPRAPAHWEARSAAPAAETSVSEGPKKAAGRGRATGPVFSIPSWCSWKLAEERKLAAAERPDPAFTETYPTHTGAFLIAPRARPEGSTGPMAIVQRWDRDGRLSAEITLAHDVYRTAVSPLGSGILFMSRDCVLHGYDSDLKPITEVGLRDNVELRTCQKRLGIGDEELRNHIRCVALSGTNDRALFTVVHEAWCLSSSGDPLWGVRGPMQEGWERVARPSLVIGTSEEIEATLEFLGLSYPFSPEDLTRRRRELAKRWHPDLNPGDATSTQRMQRLNEAVELVTGVDWRTFAADEAPTVEYRRDWSRQQVDVPSVGTFEMSMGFVSSERGAADWIYAASFGAVDDGAFLATYSGRVIRVTGDGTPIRVYDIGAVPTRIVDTGDYLYILTGTRLYIIQDDRLRNVLDVFERGDLVVGQTGFGLLAKKSFRWFREDGALLGEIRTRDPLRRVFSTAAGLIVETRQHRAVLGGTSFWWDGAADGSDL